MSRAPAGNRVHRPTGLQLGSPSIVDYGNLGIALAPAMSRRGAIKIAFAGEKAWAIGVEEVKVVIVRAADPGKRTIGPEEENSPNR